MSTALAKKHEEETLRERRCIVTGEVMPEEKLVRFVTGPDGEIVPDAAARLPGRGIWVLATRAAIDEACTRKLFARAAKAQVKATAGLVERTERALLARIIGDLGLARRCGSLVLGFDNVLRALDGKRAPALFVEARDGAPDGKRKLAGAALARGLTPRTVECLTSAELGLALGRENVIHAAVQPGGLAERLIVDTERLQGFRVALAETSGDERDR